MSQFLVYNNDLRSVIDICFYETFSTPLSNKAVTLLFSLDTLSIVLLF